eukprot:ANDGO_04408.mRNA.1 hypothetical protein
MALVRTQIREVIAIGALVAGITDTGSIHALTVVVTRRAQRATTRIPAEFLTLDVELGNIRKRVVVIACQANLLKASLRLCTCRHAHVSSHVIAVRGRSNGQGYDDGKNR